jgi:hypothetical protein
LRRTGNAVAEQAFHNIDDPLAAGIERWQRAIVLGADNFSGHFELATLAEQRDELVLAATHFERAWRLLPDRRTVLVDLGRVWQAMGRTVTPVPRCWRPHTGRTTPPRWRASCRRAIRSSASSVRHWP